jgi:hypothetical protein
MQKIQSYLYPNRIIVIADLAGFTVENTVVYAKTVKIYKGVDNVIQFDIQNADQKRLNLVTSPLVTNLTLNVMDAGGKALPNSPYTVSTTSITGIATTTIPSADTANLDAQYLQYSLTATDTSSHHIPLYTDSQFGAVGTIQLVGSAAPTTRANRVYDRFSGDINFMGNVINHSSAIPTKYYEAVPITNFSITCNMTGFVGDLYIEGTEDSTISVESFKNATRIQTHSWTTANTGTYIFSNVSFVNPASGQNFNYIRVSWMYPSVSPYGSLAATNPYGTVDLITVSY